jgi:hypothetical protein
VLLLEHPFDINFSVSTLDTKKYQYRNFWYCLLSRKPCYSLIYLNKWTTRHLINGYFVTQTIWIYEIHSYSYSTHFDRISFKITRNPHLNFDRKCEIFTQNWSILDRFGQIPAIPGDIRSILGGKFDQFLSEI